MIKSILLAVILALSLFFIKNRNTAKLRASKKILFIGFVACAAVAIIDPDVLNTIAHAVGVGRGADLLLYGLVIAFLFVTLNVYLKFKDYDTKIDQLTRTIAIEQAKKTKKSR